MIVGRKIKSFRVFRVHDNNHTFVPVLLLANLQMKMIILPSFIVNICKYNVFFDLPGRMIVTSLCTCIFILFF